MIKEYNRIKIKMTDQPVYLNNKFDKSVIRSTPGEDGKFYVKRHGRKEYEIEYWTDLVYNTLSVADEITEVEYDNH
jgi:hypothetical protein